MVKGTYRQSLNGIMFGVGVIGHGGTAVVEGLRGWGGGMGRI